MDDDKSPYAFNGIGHTDLQIVSAVHKEIKEEVDVGCRILVDLPNCRNINLSEN